MHLPDPVTYAIPAFVLLVAAEMLVAWARDKRRYEAKDTLTSLALGTGSTVAGVITGGAVFALATDKVRHELDVSGVTDVVGQGAYYPDLKSVLDAYQQAGGAVVTARGRSDSVSREGVPGSGDWQEALHA